MTRSDLALMNAELRSEIAAVGSDLRAEIAALKTELLTRKFRMDFGAVLVNTVAMAGLLFAFAKLLDY